MKSEELLNSLDYIGEDLLAEAEQNILVRTKRPWFKTAVAAVLVAAIGMGSLLLLKNVSLKPRTSSTDPIPTDHRTITTELPLLEVGETWKSVPAWVYNVSRDHSTLYDPAITQLPVYRDKVDMREYQKFGKIPFFYNEDQIEALLNEAAQRLGTSVSGAVNSFRYDGTLEGLSTQTDLGFLEVHSDGLVNFAPDAQTYTIPGSDFGENLRINADKVEAAGAEVRNLLNLPLYQRSVIDIETEFVSIFPTIDDPPNQLLARTFGNVTFTVPRKEYTNYCSWYQRLGSEGWDDVDQDWREFVGNYPLITLDEAKAQVLAGNYYSYYRFTSLTVDQLSNVDLVYPRQRDHVTMMPFFLFRLGERGEDCLCVPAIRPEFLSDYQDITAENTLETSTEERLAQLEAALPAEYFTKLQIGDTEIFSNGHTRVWADSSDSNGSILKKDVDTGKTELLFELSRPQTALIAVTADRLYFGCFGDNQSYTQECCDVYSVDYQNENRIDLAEHVWYKCEKGMIALQTGHSDVRPSNLWVIDRNDRIVLNTEMVWASAFVEGSLYYIYNPTLQGVDIERIIASDTEDPRIDLDHTQYDVCRVEADGTSTKIGSYDAHFFSCFAIDPEAKEIYGEFSFDVEPDSDGWIHADLLTLEPKGNPIPLPDDPHN